MNEDHEHTQSSLMNTSILSNKRSNFQFTYDSETNLLLLIHKYKEDIFTREISLKHGKKYCKSLMNNIMRTLYKAEL